MLAIRRTFLAVLCALSAALCIASRSLCDDGLLRIYFLDVGQGDAIYVRAPGGRDLLVDGGPTAAVLRRLSEVMPWDDRSIDAVIETHPDADHIGGLPDVLGRFRVGMFLEPGIESKNAIDDELHDKVRTHGVPDIIARRGMRLDLGRGAVFDILFPDEDVSHAPDANSASVVGRVRYGGTSIMLTGDSPRAIESHLSALDGPRLRSDILKAGHHGSRTSSGEGYVRLVGPEYTIISAGKDNRYGHPHQETLDIFSSLGIDVLRTDKEGTIGFASDGKKLYRI